LNIDRGDVTHVVMTHLHFDHCDGMTTMTGDGRFTPTFPNARHLVQRRQWDWASRRHVRDRSSYRQVSYQPIADAGLLDLVDGEHRPFEWMHMILVEGHTEAMQLPLIEMETGRRVFLPSDLVPTVRHVALPWVMSFDLRPMETMQEKQRWLTQAAEQNWTLVLQHETGHPVGLVSIQNQRFQWAQASDLDTDGVLA